MKIELNCDMIDNIVKLEMEKSIAVHIDELIITIKAKKAGEAFYDNFIPIYNYYDLSINYKEAKKMLKSLIMIYNNYVSKDDTLNYKEIIREIEDGTLISIKFVES